MGNVTICYVQYKETVPTFNLGKAAKDTYLE